ncbi:MAG TPA: hypothetical protein VII45_07150 [Solirubrobacterales bacterium]
MEVLRNLFGSLTSGIIRLLVTVGILAAAYFFIVKPVLKTTDNAINSTNQTIQKSLEAGDFKDIGNSFNGVSREIKRKIRHSFHVTTTNGGNPQKLLHCIQHANGNVTKMQRCTRRF